eukprot:GFUD01037268.1.p1 GENE.GFUD01037268.1~~GFUD01037268.1.p1  ORF type:complete len:356 (+),score=79.05 GFUD01037268.1:51-1118(+)
MEGPENYNNNDSETIKREFKEESEKKKSTDGLKKEHGNSEDGDDSTSNGLTDLNKKIEQLQKQNNALTEDLRKAAGIKKEKDNLEKKYATLTSKLQDKLECPVCLEVPISGPVPVCPNGHFVCSKCKDFYCPTCRSKMFNGKSLLAVEVIENIEHKCRNEDCGKMFPLAEYKIHLKSCKERSVLCPAPIEHCGKKMALSKVYAHILTECEGSQNKDKNQLNDGRLPKNLNLTSRIGTPLIGKSFHGLAFQTGGDIFYVNLEMCPDGYSSFSIQLLGDAIECEKYEVKIAVHTKDDSEMKGKYVHTFSGDPLAIDIDQGTRKRSGLLVGFMQMEKITVKDGDSWECGLTFDIIKRK